MELSPKESSSNYSIRLWFWLSDGTRLEHPEGLFEFDVIDCGKIKLQPMMAKEFTETSRYEITVSGFSSANCAHAKSLRIIEALKFTAMSNRLGIDLGSENFELEDVLVTKEDQKALDDKHAGEDFDFRGLWIFEGEPRRRAGFANTNITGHRRVTKICERLEKVLRLIPSYDKADKIAIDLLSTSYFAAHSEVKFLMYYTGLEAIASQNQPLKNDSIQKLIDEFLGIAEECDLDPTDSHRLKSHLEGFRRLPVLDSMKQLILEYQELESYQERDPTLDLDNLSRIRNAISHGSKKPLPNLSEYNSLLGDTLLSYLWAKYSISLKKKE